MCHAMHDTAYVQQCFRRLNTAVIAQLGERKTEDLKVSGNSCNVHQMTVILAVWPTVPLNIAVNYHGIVLNFEGKYSTSLKKLPNFHR